MARKIANTSALFISIAGMGVEKTHLKDSLLSRKTPPIAERDRALLYEASTFHFNILIRGGSQPTSEAKGLKQPLLITSSDHNRLEGFFEMSSYE